MSKAKVLKGAELPSHMGIASKTGGNVSWNILDNTDLSPSMSCTNDGHDWNNEKYWFNSIEGVHTQGNMKCSIDGKAGPVLTFDDPGQPNPCNAKNNTFIAWRTDPSAVPHAAPGFFCSNVGADPTIIDTYSCSGWECNVIGGGGGDTVKSDCTTPYDNMGCLRKLKCKDDQTSVTKWLSPGDDKAPYTQAIAFYEALQGQTLLIGLRGMQPLGATWDQGDSNPAHVAPGVQGGGIIFRDFHNPLGAEAPQFEGGQWAFGNPLAVDTLGDFPCWDTGSTTCWGCGRPCASGVTNPYHTCVAPDFQEITGNVKDFNAPVLEAWSYIDYHQEPTPILIKPNPTSIKEDETISGIPLTPYKYLFNDSNNLALFANYPKNPQKGNWHPQNSDDFKILFTKYIFDDGTPNSGSWAYTLQNKLDNRYLTAPISSWSAGKQQDGTVIFKDKLDSYFTDDETQIWGFHDHGSGGGDERSEIFLVPIGVSSSHGAHASLQFPDAPPTQPTTAGAHGPIPSPIAGSSLPFYNGAYGSLGLGVTTVVSGGSVFSGAQYWNGYASATTSKSQVRPVTQQGGFNGGDVQYRKDDCSILPQSGTEFNDDNYNLNYPSVFCLVDEG